MDQRKTDREHANEAAPPNRSLLVYVVPIVLRVFVVLYFVLRPPSPGVFCAAGTGCYDVDFGNGFNDAMIEVHSLDGLRAHPFPLKRTSWNTFAASFDSDKPTQIVIEDDNRLVRDGHTIYVRTPPEHIPRHLAKARNTLRRAHEEVLARKKTEEAASAWQEYVRDQWTRAKLSEAFEEQRKQPYVCILPRRYPKNAEEPCHCAPGDPLCSCL